MRKLAMKLGVIAILLQIIVSPAEAQINSSYNIRLLVGTDNTPPTMPVITSLIPITSDQIDIEWSASIDDVQLMGYRLFRDGVQIATTTQTTYNDTGLAASTTYSYTVDAFDYSNNYSSTSPAEATTTLPIIVEPPATTTDSSGLNISIARARLESFEIRPATQSADIAWTTSAPTQYIIKWGRTVSYELGAVSGSIYKRSHETTINHLEPGTRYFYELTLINGRNTPGQVSTGEFTTLPVTDQQRPTNVLDFKAIAADDSVELSWRNPNLNDLYKVRVVRSHLFYPGSPIDGGIVYEGTGEGAFDTDALKDRSPQYYTIFVYDQAGNISSGAVAVAYRGVMAGSTGPGLQPPEAATTTVPQRDLEVGDDSILMASQVKIEQSSVIYFLHEKVTLDSHEPYLISIDATALPKHLKSIIATIEDPTDNHVRSSYLLRLNTDGDRYEAVIPGRMVAGEGRLTIEVFDYQAATIRRISNVVVYVSADNSLPFPDNLLQASFWLPAALIIFAILCLFFIIVFRRRRREDNR